MARKSSSRMIVVSPLEDVFMVDGEENDLSYWEFVNNSDGEYSDDSLSVESLPDDIVSFDLSSSLSSSPSAPPPAVEIGPDPMIAHVDLDVRDDVENNLRNVSGFSSYDYGDTYGFYGYGHDHGDEEEEKEEEENDDDDDDGSYDLDDELVPKYVSGKLGRQRMRKLGKRLFSKVTTSKRSPYSHVKPGCVYGKHGLGMKFK